MSTTILQNILHVVCDLDPCGQGLPTMRLTPFRKQSRKLLQALSLITSCATQTSRHLSSQTIHSRFLDVRSGPMGLSTSSTAGKMRRGMGSWNQHGIRIAQLALAQQTTPNSSQHCAHAVRTMPYVPSGSPRHLHPYRRRAHRLLHQALLPRGCHQRRPPYFVGSRGCCSSSW